MKEIQEILDRVAVLGSEPMALATLVKVRGSSYRKPGARLLIRRDGSTIGSISGGCVEQDVAKKAIGIIDGGGPQLAVFDMTGPEDELWGYGQGCNGVLSILTEAINGSEPQFDLIREVIERRSPGVIATVINVQGEIRARLGTRLLLFPNGKIQENILNPFVASPVAEEAARLQNLRSSAKTFQFTEGSVEVFFETVRPPISLTIVGAGTDALPLCKLAADLGWRVQIVDHRESLAKKERFPVASRIIVGAPEKLDGTIEPDSRSAVVIMTHNFRHDLIFLAAFLKQAFPYVGLLGPKHRFDKLLDRLKRDGIEFDPSVLARLHTPVGLDLAAESPEEIALAIVAEIQGILGKS